LRRYAGVGVDHVAIIDPSDVGQLVDGIGGIRVNNPKTFDVQVSPVATWHFERGPLNLDGPHAVVYLRRGMGSGKVIGQADLDVLRGIVHRLLQPADVGELQATGATLARAAATDFSDADVVGLVYARLQGGSTVECRVGSVPLTSTRAQSTLRAFLGRDAAAGSSGCSVRPIHSQSFLPPKAVVALVQRFGWEVFAASAALALMLMLLVGSGFLLRWRRAVRPAGWPLPSARPILAQPFEPRMRDYGVAVEALDASLPIRDAEPVTTPDAEPLSTPKVEAKPFTRAPTAPRRSDSGQLLPASVASTGPSTKASTKAGLLGRARRVGDQILESVYQVGERAAARQRGAARRWGAALASAASLIPDAVADRRLRRSHHARRREALSSAASLIPDAIADRRLRRSHHGRRREALSNAVWWIPDAIADRRLRRFYHGRRVHRPRFDRILDLWASVRQRGPLVTALVVFIALLGAVLVSAFALAGLWLYVF
jgi:hypothetical protein